MPNYLNTPNTLIFVHAMSRSGQHPIIDWIYNQFENPKVFFNYMKFLKTGDLFEYRSQYYLNDKKYFYRLNPNWEKYGVLEEKLKEYGKEGVEQHRELFDNNRNLLMMNFENINFSSVSNNFNDFLCQFSSKKKILNVLILRDIYNYLASKIKMGRYFFPETNLACWKVHAREFLGDQNFLKNKVAVSYNNWVVDEDYRKNIALQIGVDNFIPMWNEVSSFGGGSSFDGLSYQKSGQKMKVLERWKNYIDTSEYQTYLKDGELIELSDRVFGKVVD